MKNKRSIFAIALSIILLFTGLGFNGLIEAKAANNAIISINVSSNEVHRGDTFTASSVTNIGDYSFKQCSNLTVINSFE